MNIKNGSFRKVLIFKNIVFKIPRNIKGIFANINEYYNWLKYRNLRHLVVPTYVSMFGIINICKSVSTEVNDCHLDKYCFIVKNIIPHPILNDININNIGILNNVIVKLDYGNDFWWDNIFKK